MLPRAAVATNDGDRCSRPCPLASACAQSRALKAVGLGGEGRHSARLAFAAPEISSEVCEVCTNGRLVDPIGIEVGIIPFDHALMVEMLGVGDRLQKGLIAGWSADIRRRTAALRTDEAQIIDAGRRFFDRLQLDRVSPIFPYT